MDASRPSARSRTRSSPAPSKAGSPPAAAAPPRATAAGRARAPARAAAPARRVRAVPPLELIDRFATGDFPLTLYLDGPSEAVKTALLGELRRAWARAVPDAPLARVFRASESGVEEILGAFQGASLFSPRDLVLVLGVEALSRSEKRVAALAEGLARPAGESCLVLHEADTDTPRKSLDVLRAACAVRCSAEIPERAELVRWGARRLDADGLEVEAGVVEVVADECERDPLTFFNEIEKLAVVAPVVDGRRRVTRADADALLQPVLGADLPAYLAAVALGDGARAGRALTRMLAEGVGEGAVLFALGNMVSGTLGGWTIPPAREPSEALRRRRTPRQLAGALDAVYRAEAAWKSGRADVLAVLEQATRSVCG
jgi:DNA polymerase III delta subunit